MDKSTEEDPSFALLGNVTQEALASATQAAYEEGLQDGYKRARQELKKAINSLLKTVTLPSDSIDNLGLSERPRNALVRQGIKTIGQLVERSKADLLGITGFGNSSLNEVKSKLAECGLRLRDG